MVLSTLMRLVLWLWEFVVRWFRYIRMRRGTVITLDTGKRVVMGNKIAEGGFSFVFEAFDADIKNRKYALKRIHCPDPELLQDCRREAAVHRAVKHPNVMPLLGFAVHQTNCYMLFPYCQQSLRDVVNRRNPLMHPHLPLQNQNRVNVNTVTTKPPWSECTALNLFLKICAGVQALHEHDYSHRDIKLENVLLLGSHFDHPVLMDFGSAGPVEVPVTARRHALHIVEQAAQHTTMPYRPPELFEGGIQSGPDASLDYRAVDIWSLACTLHAILYGASPFECDFVSSAQQQQQRGGGGGGSVQLKIVECTHLSVLGNHLPTPQPPVDAWYSSEIRSQLLEPMLSQDRFQRPTLVSVMATTEGLIRKLGGSVDRSSGILFSSEEQRQPFQDNDDDDDEPDGIALMSRVV